MNDQSKDEFGQAIEATVRPRPVDLAHAPDFAVGPVTVRPSMRTLAGPSGTVTLEPKVMQVMVALGDASGAIQSRDDLIERCWDGRVVGDTSINRVISLLRGGLKDVAGDAVTVENVPKVGYHLASDEGEEAFAVPSPKTEPAPDQAPNKPKRRLIRIGGAVLAVIVLAATLIFWRPFGAAALATVRIAMLPMQSDESIDTFYAQGMAAELRSTLGQQKGLKVTSPESAAQLLEADLDPLEIGERLDVDYIWRGTLSNRADSVSLQATLISVETGETVWSDTIAGAPNMTETIPLRSARSMMTGINRPMGAIANDAPLSQDDYRLFVIAKGHLRTRDQSQLPETLSILRTLTRDNPKFGAGWALLANGTAFDFTRGEDVDRATLMAEAQRYITRGLEVAPSSPDVLSIAGLLAQDPSRARNYLEQAVALDPGDAQAHFWLGHAKNGQGDSASALVSYENVLRLDPLWTRAGTLPEYPAARGDVDRADGWDRLIIAAAGEAWQADLARSRIARRNGRWADSIRLMR